MDDLVVDIGALEVGKEIERQKMVEVTIKLARLNLTEFEEDLELFMTASKLEEIVQGSKKHTQS